MSDILYLYDPAVRRRVEAGEDIESIEVTISPSVQKLVIQELERSGFRRVAHDDEAEEFVHENDDWGLQAMAFSSEISVLIPSFAESEATQFASELILRCAKMTGLQVHDPQNDQRMP